MSNRSSLGTTALASLARRPARRRRPLRHRHALLRDGPRGRRRAPQRRRRRAAIGQRAARRRAPSKPPKPASTGRLHASTIRPGSAPIACRAPTRRRVSFRERMVRIDVPSGDLAPRTWTDGGTPVPLQAACVRGANGWTCRCPARRSARPAGVRRQRHGAGLRRRARRVDTSRRRSRAGDRLHAQRLPARPARRASMRPAKRRSRLEAAWAMLPALRAAPAAALTVHGDVDVGAASLGVHNVDAASGALAVHAGGRIGATALRIGAPPGRFARRVARRRRRRAARAVRRPLLRAHLRHGTRRVGGAARRAPGRLRDRLRRQRSAPRSTPAQRLLVIEGDATITGPAAFGSADDPIVLVADRRTAPVGRYRAPWRRPRRVARMERHDAGPRVRPRRGRRRRLPRQRRRRSASRRGRAGAARGRQRQLRSRQRQLEGLPMTRCPHRRATAQRRDASAASAWSNRSSPSSSSPSARPPPPTCRASFAWPATSRASDRRRSASARRRARTCASFAALDGAPGQRSFTDDRERRRVGRPRRRRRPRTPTTGSSVASTTLAFGATKSTRVAVRWRDRSGNEREVVLHSLIAGIAPAYAGSLALATGAIPSAPRGAFERAPALPLTARKPRRRSQRLEAERARTDRAGVRRPQRRHRRPLRRRRRDAGDARPLGRGARGLRDRSLAARRRDDPLRVGGCARSRPSRTSRRCRPRSRHHPSRRRLSGAGRLLQRSEEDGALPRRRQPSPRRCRRRRDRRGGGARRLGRDRRSLPRLALRRHAARRRSLVGPGRVASATAGRSAPAATSIASAATCRPSINAIDANIAPAGDDVDVGAALLGRNFLVVGGSERCPGDPRTRAVPALSENATNTNR